MTPHQNAQASDQMALGIGLIIVSVLAMAFGDAMVKLMSDGLTVWQIFVARSAFALPVLLVMARFSAGGLSALAVRAPGWVFLRSALLVLTWLCFYASLPLLPLSVAAAVAYANPIITTLMSAWLIGDAVTRRQWAGVALGFLGVLVILRPAGDDFTWAVLLPLLAAVLYAGSMVLTRVKCRSESAMTLGLGVHAGLLVTGVVAAVVLGVPALIVLPTGFVEAHTFIATGWQPMGGIDWLTMALLGLLSAGYIVGVARAYQIAPLPVIATFDYGYLVSAALWGFVLFTEVPDIMTWLGMA